jgi:hypothetical protein
LKKYLTAFLGLILLSSLAYAEITRAQFLNNQRAGLVTEVAELQAAKDASLANQGRIDRINYGLPILEALIAEVLDGELRGDWLELYEKYSAEAASWEADIAGWDEQIAEAQDKVDEIDRLLAE